MCSARVGGVHTRRCIHKAVHTQGSLWPPQESCYLRGGAGAGPRVERSEPNFFCRHRGGGGGKGVYGGEVWGGKVCRGCGGEKFGCVWGVCGRATLCILSPWNPWLPVVENSRVFAQRTVSPL